MFFLFVILLQGSHALGVEVTEGVESVQLPCQVNVSVSSESTVVWSREDLKFSTLHIRQQNRDDLGEQNQRYSNRTRMRTNALQTGDLSLTLMKPTVSDSETYTCTIRRFGQELNRINVPLKVKEPPPVWPKYVWSVLGLLVVLAVVFGSVFYCKYQKAKCNAAYKLRLVRALEGQKFVRLPCKTRTRLPPDATVEWRRIDTDTVVYMYSNHQEHQSESNHSHTEMRKKPLKTGNLSLTLHNPSPDDNDLYVCTVQKNEHVLKQRVVSLSVEGRSVLDGDIRLDGDLRQNVRIWDWIKSTNISKKNTLRRSLKSSIGQSSQNHPSVPSSNANDSDSEAHQSDRDDRGQLDNEGDSEEPEGQTVNM